MNIYKTQFKRRWSVISEEFTTKKKAEEHLKDLLIATQGTPTEPGVYLIETTEGRTIAQMSPEGLLESVNEKEIGEVIRFWRLNEAQTSP